MQIVLIINCNRQIGLFKKFSEIVAVFMFKRTFEEPQSRKNSNSSS